MKFGISAIPTVILFKNGQVSQKFVGLRAEKDFKEEFRGLLHKYRVEYDERYVWD